MSLLTNTTVVGVACGLRSCEREQRTDPLPYFSAETDAFLALLLTEGWARRVGRSVTWFCPVHADRAGRCLKGKWGMCSPHCPVHGNGFVTTWETEDEKRLAGQRNMLTRAAR